MIRFESGEHIDIGKLTSEETQELAKAALNELAEEERLAVLEAILTPEQKQELSEVWYNAFRDRGRK